MKNNMFNKEEFYQKLISLGCEENKAKRLAETSHENDLFVELIEYGYSLEEAEEVIREQTEIFNFLYETETNDILIRYVEE